MVLIFYLSDRLFVSFNGYLFPTLWDYFIFRRNEFYHVAVSRNLIERRWDNDIFRLGIWCPYHRQA